MIGYTIFEKVSYDPSIDALYIRVKDWQVKESQEISESIIVDYDTHNTILWYEILDAKNQRDVIEKILFGQFTQASWLSFSQNIS